MPYFSIGVDLGGTNMRVASIEESGRMLEVVNANTDVKRGRDNVINEMCDVIRAQAEKHRKRATLIGVGIGVPGIIDMQTGMLHESPNLPGWQDYPVRQEIERRLQSRVILENDANAAALGEFWLGAGKDVDDMCMFTLGTGVGGGLIFGGRIWHGMTGMAAELGHVTVEPNGVLCGCGNHGCVEQYASATAVKRMATELIAAGKAPELAKAVKAANVEVSAKIVYELAMQGDPPAQQVFDKLAESLGTVIATFINALNLPMYVIGGGVSLGWDAFAPKMLETIRKRSYVYVATRPSDRPIMSGRSTIVTRAELGSDAGLIGAARLPITEASKATA